MDQLTQAVTLTCSAQGLQSILDTAMDHHLHFIHRTRQIMIRRLLPQADTIVDLGGANAPLYRMGYSHPFKRMLMVDLPDEERAAEFANKALDVPDVSGVVEVVYADMTAPAMIEDESVDLVWSGQSIEHVPVERAEAMCQGAFRMLRPGGYFCLDTPNRKLTAVHTRDWHGGYINPDHKYEYHAAELRQMLVSAGFIVEQELGVCEMPKTCETGNFHYEDFVLGNPLTLDVDRGYCLFYSCRKPA